MLFISKTIPNTRRGGGQALLVPFYNVETRQEGLSRPAPFLRFQLHRRGPGLARHHLRVIPHEDGLHRRQGHRQADIETHQMEFIRLSDHIESIECVAISPTHNHIAVCEKIKNENFLLLNLYGLRGRDSEIKHFKLPQTDRQATFKIIAFAPSQPKYACCMTS